MKEDVVKRIVDLYRDAYRGLARHHWPKLIVRALRSLADVEASRLDDFSVGEDAHRYAAALQAFADGQERRLDRLSTDERVPWFALDDAERDTLTALWTRRATRLCGKFARAMEQLEIGPVAPCTFEDGVRWYEGEQLDADGDFDGSDPLESKPWRYQYVVEDYGWSHAMPNQKVTFKRKWGKFGTWTRLADDHDTGRERRAIMDYSQSAPRAILGWTIERSYCTGEAPCIRCNDGGTEGLPTIIRDTCPFCDGSGYLHTDNQVVVYIRNK